MVNRTVPSCGFKLSFCRGVFCGYVELLQGLSPEVKAKFSPSSDTYHDVQA